MTRTELLLLAGAVGAAVVAVLYWRSSSPAAAAPSVPDGAIGALLSLPDPASVPLGTVRGAGGASYITTQSKLPGSRPQWSFAGFGGGVPGMIT